MAAAAMVAAATVVAAQRRQGTLTASISTVGGVACSTVTSCAPAAARALEMLAGGIAVSVAAASWIVVTLAKRMASTASTTTDPALNVSVRRHAGSWQPSVVRRGGEVFYLPGNILKGPRRCPRV